MGAASPLEKCEKMMFAPRSDPTIGDNLVESRREMTGSPIPMNQGAISWITVFSLINVGIHFRKLRKCGKI